MLLGAHGAPLYRVSGHVVNELTGGPVPKAVVMVMKAGEIVPVVMLKANDDGSFRLELPAGAFDLKAGTHETQRLTTGPNLDLTGIVVAWLPASSISGRILDPFGDPVENASVQLIRSSASTAQTYSDDRGEYRFGGLSGGDYRLEITAHPWYTSLAIDTNNQRAFETLHSKPMALKPGEEVRADFTMRETSGATLSVECSAPATIMARLTLFQQQNGGAETLVREIQTRCDVPRPLTGLPPGVYFARLRVNAEGVSYAARQRIDLGATDVSITLEPRPMAIVSGTLKSNRGPATIMLTRSGTTERIEATVRADGAFTFPAVEAGRYSVEVRSDKHVAIHVEVTAARYADGLLTVDEGEQLKIGLTAAP
jgi:hypothetical protein